MEYLKSVTYVMKAIGEPSPATEKDARDMVRLIKEQPKDSGIWLKIKELGGIRHMNIMHALVDDINP